MAKRLKKKVSAAAKPVRVSKAKATLSSLGLPLLLAAVTFLVYWPSLKSDLVYDARTEILEEGFITSLSNLPAVLSLKVLGMNLMLADRPGELLYLMLIAAVSGRDPFGYHLANNILHAANAALLFVVLGRLLRTEQPELEGRHGPKVKLALVAVTLIFALHPMACEPVAAVNYSSDLLVTFFTLLALLSATAFNPANLRAGLLVGGAGVLCCFAAVTAKESGAAAAPILVAYWFLFRRTEAKGCWLWFLGSALATTAAFLTARFLLALPAEIPAKYLGGSFPEVLSIQPRLWVFMMGQLVCPTRLSADYTLENLGGLTTPFALAILFTVLLLQAWLAAKSRTGALGAVVYWLGLATVSNFIPLYRILGDRFYYLPLAGVAMQLLALLMVSLRFREGFWAAAAACFVAILPLTYLTVVRETVFATSFNLWSETVQASPYSANAHCNLGLALSERGQTDEAIEQTEIALKLAPTAEDDNNLGDFLRLKGQLDEAMAEFQLAVKADPTMAKAHDNLGCVYLLKGRWDDAITEIQKAVEINPDYIDAHYNLGIAFMEKKEPEEAIPQFETVLRLNPDDADAQNKLAAAQTMAGQNRR